MLVFQKNGTQINCKGKKPSAVENDVKDNRKHAFSSTWREGASSFLYIFYSVQSVYLGS